MLGLVLSLNGALYLWNRAIRYVELHEAGIFTMIEVPLGVVLVSRITGVTVPAQVWIGLLLVLASAATLALRARTKST